MQEFKATKNLKALQIAGFDGSQVRSADETMEPIDLGHEFMGRYSPSIGGYYIVHDGGFASYLPAEVFEAEYTKV